MARPPAASTASAVDSRLPGRDASPSARATGDGDVHPALRKRDGDGAADAARRAGDDRRGHVDMSSIRSGSCMLQGTPLTCVPPPTNNVLPVT